MMRVLHSLVLSLTSFGLERISRPQQETDLCMGHTSFVRSLMEFPPIDGRVICDWRAVEKSGKGSRLLQFLPEENQCRT